MDNSRKKLRLGDVLVNSGVISEEQLQKGLELQKGSGRKLGETLVDEGLVSEENITNALSSQLNLDVIDLQNVTVSEDILSLVRRLNLRFFLVPVLVARLMLPLFPFALPRLLLLL